MELHNLETKIDQVIDILKLIDKRGEDYKLLVNGFIRTTFHINFIDDLTLCGRRINYITVRKREKGSHGCGFC